MKGTIVNAAVVVAGAVAGTLCRSSMPDQFRGTLTNGLALAVSIIGMQMAGKTENILIVIGSLVAGGLLGEIIDIEAKLQRMGEWLSGKLGKRFGDVGQGFVTATLVFCVGAMAIVGAIQDGIAGDATTLYAKAMLDGILSVVFAASLGIGVAFSGVSILLYQGAITLLATLFGAVLSAVAITELTATGGVLIIAISLRVLELKEIRVANLLPAIPIAAILATIFK